MEPDTNHRPLSTSRALYMSSNATGPDVEFSKLENIYGYEPEVFSMHGNSVTQRKTYDQHVPFVVI